MGSGFLESVYQEALEYQFNLDGIPFEAQKKIQIFYASHPLKQYFVADLVCYEKIIVELKSLKMILPEHKAQLLNYLKATNIRLGLLVNFGAPQKVQIERLINIKREF